MIKKTLIIALITILTSCKNDKIDDTPLNVQGAVATSRLIEDFTCGNITYVFQIPFYQGTKELENRLNNDIKSLITQDFIDLTYNKEASLEEIWNLFISDRERKICAGDNSGINSIQIEHLSQNDGFLSYELTYIKNDRSKRLTKTFLKPEFTELKTIDLAKENRKDDVRRIFDINLQQSVANLSLDIKTEDYNGFKEFVENKAFIFNKSEFEESSPGIKILGKDSLMLQVSKKIDIPSNYSYLNEDVKVEIRAQEMDYYLDLSSLKI